MKWFGVSWGALICAQDGDQIPVPVGELCVHCDEAIDPTDSGVVYVNGPVAHRNCFLRSVFGSIAHLQHRCSCYRPGSTCGDPPGLTKREAADAVAHFLEFDV